MRIALSGYYGFDNAGDEALLSAITSSILQYAPEAEFVVFSGAPKRTIRLHGIRAVYYLNPLQIFKELWQADLLISGGGSIFQDVTSPRSLPYYISVVALARLLSKPVIFYAQGVGPIKRRFSKFLMRLVSNKVNLITLRDETSLNYLRQLGVKNPSLMVTADPVFSLEPKKSDAARILILLEKLNPLNKPLVGVSIRKWAALEGYQTTLAKLLDNLAAQGYQVLFIPMAYPEDNKEAKKVTNLMNQKAIIVEEHLNSKEHLALIAQLDIMIAMRLHALIFAASRGIPFAGISYDPKVDAFLQIFSLAPLPLELNEMQSCIDELLNNANLQVHIKKIAQDLHGKAGQNALLALSLINPKTNYNNQG